MTDSYRFGALTLTDHTLTVPLDWDAPEDGRTIEVFARVISREGGEELPYLVYLQGGPGFEAPRPGDAPAEPAWLPVALEHYRVVMLDERGTGRSTAVGDRLLEGRTADEVADYLTHFRADSIVRDCEAIREHLDVPRWNVLGQSFGGFSTLTYLSRYADSIDQAYITGGLSAVGRHCDEVYASCYDRMRELSQAYYRRFPNDREKIRAIAEQAAAGEIVLPTGEVLSVSRLRSLGMQLGGDHGWKTLHWLLEQDPTSNAFRHDVAATLPFSPRNPIYYVMHESSYADGVVTDWSAMRTMPEDFVSDPSLLTGEHVSSEWLDTVPAYRPWAEVTQKLAAHQWPKLYDADALAASNARGAASVYLRDAFVPFDFSMQTAELLPGVQVWVTSEHEHSGLRTSNGAVLDHLIGLAKGARVR
ncbi:proline iminopeptidase [Propionibacteriaceae bacterium ES.041]|uniref:alpha/beta fold hydrolase n=1 Tax=Enemella evansiae TaxID=2016499 RepID=UPI000B96AAC6|nr:alpha/beta fold hydrolase [Enemella evansiae]OYN93738.1 aminopeptidase [Enemella evansiae]PFG66697.1 proline iminopeptidase [Propionibacteriaceae bacterium ES.041]